MSKKIYVGNMSYSTDEETLTNLFADYGEVVSTKIISDQFTGKSKGFAFVEMQNDDEAMSAISALNGKELNGREIKVNEAIDKNRRGDFNSNSRGNRFKRNNRY